VTGDAPWRLRVDGSLVSMSNPLRSTGPGAEAGVDFVRMSRAGCHKV
jgi:hypothetical protein